MSDRIIRIDCFEPVFFVFLLADRTNGRAYVTLLCPSVVCLL